MTAKKFNLKDFLINNGIIVVLVLLAIYTGIMQPTFVSGSNLKNIALNVAPRFIIACGVSGCLITKGTDLSAGRMVGLSACLAGTLLQKADYSGKFFPNMPFYGVWWVAAVLLICVAVCAIFGAINGIVVSYLQVPAFIGTLGMQLIVYGVCLVYTNATPIGGYRAAYTEVAKGQLFGFIPYLFLIALAVGIVMWFVYNKMPPTMIPGRLIGKITFIKASIRAAPRLKAASIMSSSIFSITPATVTIIRGRNRYTEPMIMEKSVYSSFNGFGTTPSPTSTLLIMPLLPRILIHAKLRITELVIIGKMEAARRIPLHFLLHRLIK